MIDRSFDTHDYGYIAPQPTPSVEVVSDEISISRAVTVPADDMLASDTIFN